MFYNSRRIGVGKYKSGSPHSLHSLLSIRFQIDKTNSSDLLCGFDSFSTSSIIVRSPVKEVMLSCSILYPYPSVPEDS